MIVINNKVAAAPFPLGEEEKVKIVGGMAVSNQLEDGGELVGLEVVFDSENFIIGGKVFLPPSAAEAPWAKKIYHHEGCEFILVPEDAIVAMEFDEADEMEEGA